MIRVLVDSNVLLDFIARREWFAISRKLVVFAEMGDFELWMSPSQVSDVFYIASSRGKRSLAEPTKRTLRHLRKYVHVCTLGENDVDRALASRWEDLEDALVYQAAIGIGADVILTRNKDDFELSSIPVMDAEEFFGWMEAEKGLIFEEITW